MRGVPSAPLPTPTGRPPQRNEPSLRPPSRRESLRLFRRSVRSRCIRHAASSPCGEHGDSVHEGGGKDSKSLLFLNYGHYVLGSPGVGKTHLSVALAEAAIQSGFGAYFMTAHDLVNDLGRAYREGRLDRRMRVYLAPKVLIIDEMGYLPLDELGATIFFQLVSARYERGSIILTSNKSYGD